MARPRSLLHRRTHCRFSTVSQNRPVKFRLIALFQARGTVVWSLSGGGSPAKSKKPGFAVRFDPNSPSPAIWLAYLLARQNYGLKHESEYPKNGRGQLVDTFPKEVDGCTAAARVSQELGSDGKPKRDRYWDDVEKVSAADYMKEYVWTYAPEIQSRYPGVPAAGQQIPARQDSAFELQQGCVQNSRKETEVESAENWSGASSGDRAGFLNSGCRIVVKDSSHPMKIFTIGLLAFVLFIPAPADAAPAAGHRGDKFGSVVPLNYTRVAGARGSYRGAYGRYRGGYYGRGPYGYYGGRYGYRFPYYGDCGWYGGFYPYGGNYGYPYSASYAYGAAWPLAYDSNYYAAAAPYAGYQQPFLLRPVRSRTSSRVSRGSFITNVQSALKSRGFYAGPVDGDFGPSSQKAFAAFQQANGMPATGTLDSPALSALGVDGKSAKSKPTQTAPRKSSESTFAPPPISSPVQPPGIPAEPPLIGTPAQPPVAPLQPPPIPGG